MTQTHAHRIIRQLGAEAIVSALKVSEFSVKSAKSAGRFPARWYAPLKELCDQHGIPCPLSAFNFMDPDKKTVRADDGDEAGLQGASSERGIA